MQLTKADAAVEAALSALRASGAMFRLRDIQVEEVSLVDRAANRRRFFVVKQGDAMADAATAVKKVELPAQVRDGLMRTLTDVLERQVKVVNTVKQATATDAQLEQPVPQELGQEILEVCKLLEGTLSQYPSGVTMRAEATPVDLLVGFVQKVLGAEAPVALTAESLSGLGTEVADKLQILGKVMALIADAESPDELAALGNRMLGVGKALKREGNAAQVLSMVADVASAVADGEAELQPEAVAKVKQLVGKLNELVEQPTANGDGAMTTQKTQKQETTSEGAGTGEQPPAEGAETTAKQTDGQPAAGDGTAAAAGTGGSESAGSSEGAGSGEGAGEGDGEELHDGEAVSKMAEAVATGVVSLTKAGRKMSKARLGKLRTAVSALSDLLGELDDATILDGKKTAKMVAESTPQPPKKDASSTNVAHGGPPDPRNDQAENSPAIQAIQKRFDELQEQVKKLSETPEPPASRSNEGASTPGTPSNGKRPGKRVVW